MPIELTPATPIIMGCYYCFSIMREEEIDTWHGDYAECPCCGIDSITPYSTCLGIGDILIDLERRAEKAWAIVDDDGNPTGDHMIPKFRSKNEAE